MAYSPIAMTVDLAIGRYARFSRPSNNLIGGTHPVPHDSPRSQPDTELLEKKHLTGWFKLRGGRDNPEDFAIGRYARFSRPSENLVGGTQPLADSGSEFFIVRDDSAQGHYFNIPDAPERSARSRWLGPGESITVAGLTLPDGLIYAGKNDARLRNIEPSFIDTASAVSSSSVDLQTPGALYLSTYQSLSPESRKGYLQWLAGGRCDPSTDIGYVFMFFQGLERRMLVDTASDAAAREELPAIKAEVERLKALYARDASFYNHAYRLLDYLSMSAIPARMYLNEPPETAVGIHEVPICVRVALGQMATDHYPLNASWAMAWALTDPNISLRTPAVRCPELFQRLFREEYEATFPRGLTLANNKTRLKASYWPLSPRIDTQKLSIGDLPDVTATSGTRKKLQIIVEKCAQVLEPFSRYVGRNPEKPYALDGLLRLPTTLWPEHAKQELSALQAGVGHDAILMTLVELTQRFNSIETLSRDKVVALAKALEERNIGMEPDVLSGSRTPKAEDNIVLFAAEPEDGTLRATPDYQAAVVTLDLASAVAAADGEANQDEVASLGLHIDSWSHLCVAHRKRLKAHLQIQLLQPPSLASLKKKLEPLRQEDKRTIVCFLAHLAQADGTVTPEEIKLLERVYKALQLDPRSMYSDLHGAAANSFKGPDVIGAPRSNISAASRTATLSTNRQSGSGIVLDMARVAQLQRETAQVSALLATVFTDEQEEQTPTMTEDTPQGVPETGVRLYGLDPEHSAFLRLLVSRSEWSRQELENAASDMELMLDGALEQINDMAFELFNMPISEGDDPVDINPDILSELTL
ncbi:TerB N-terminal domain-containing protein [Pseudomonas alliivorans]|nr:TerB N-terminal domain-containing protein [Pseudomonas alliivorans]